MVCLIGHTKEPVFSLPLSLSLWVKTWWHRQSRKREALPSHCPNNTTNPLPGPPACTPCHPLTLWPSRLFCNMCLPQLNLTGGICMTVEIRTKTGKISQNTDAVHRSCNTTGAETQVESGWKSFPVLCVCVCFKAAFLSLLSHSRVINSN